MRDHDPYERIRPYEPDKLPHYPRQRDYDNAAAAAGCMVLAGVVGTVVLLLIVAGAVIRLVLG